AAVGAVAGWLVELPQAASAPTNAPARTAIQIRRYIELCLLLSYHASLVAVLPQYIRIVPPGQLIRDEKSMRGLEMKGKGVRWFRRGCDSPALSSDMRGLTWWWGLGRPGAHTQRVPGASPRSPFSQLLWRHSRHSNWERKDFGG